MIQYITSRKNKIVLETIDLRKNKIQQEKRLFIIEGEHLLEMANNANNLSYVLTTKHLNNINQDVDQYIVPKDILEKISINKSAPNVISVCKFINDKINVTSDIICLDCIQDPGNLGTIFRSSLAFSYFDILISKDSVNKYNEKVVQSSQGAIFNLNIESFDINELKKFKNKGYKIVVTTLTKDSINLADFKKKSDEKYIYVFGNEGKGVRKEIQDIADYKIFIEMKNIDSLNVGVAAGIVLYSLKNQKNNYQI